MENKPPRCHSLWPDFTEGSRIAKTLLWLENPGNGLCKFVWEHRDFMYLFVHTSPILAKLDPVEVWKLLVVKEKTAQRMHTLYYSAMSSLNDKKTVKHNLHKQLLSSHKIGNCMCKFGRQDTARANFINTSYLIDLERLFLSLLLFFVRRMVEGRGTGIVLSMTRMWL